jgi:hypothetical protein
MNKKMLYIKLIQNKLLEMSNYVQALQENDPDNSELIFEIYAKNMILQKLVEKRYYLK